MKDIIKLEIHHKDIEKLERVIKQVRRTLKPAKIKLDYWTTLKECMIK